jgi:hypothetical protein
MEEETRRVFWLFSMFPRGFFGSPPAKVEYRQAIGVLSRPGLLKLRGSVTFVMFLYLGLI